MIYLILNCMISTEHIFIFSSFYIFISHLIFIRYFSSLFKLLHFINNLPSFYFITRFLFRTLLCWTMNGMILINFQSLLENLQLIPKVLALQDQKLMLILPIIQTRMWTMEMVSLSNFVALRMNIE